MRLRHKENGVVVDVSDDKAARMDAKLWEPADRPAPEPTSKPRGRRRKSDDATNED